MSCNRRRLGSCSAALQAQRALLLAEGRRRFYCFPLGVGPYSKLGKVPHSSMSDCIASAHLWIQRARAEDSWWFTVIERAELNGQSCVASYRDILVFNDLLPLSPGSEVKGDAIREAARKRVPNREQAVAAPGTGTFIATDGRVVPCRRRKVPQYG